MKITICERWKTTKTNLQSEVSRLHAVIVAAANKVREECGQCPKGSIHLGEVGVHFHGKQDIGEVAIQWHLNPQVCQTADVHVVVRGVWHTAESVKHFVQQHSCEPLGKLELAVELLRSQTAEAVELAVIASLIPEE